MLWGAMTDYRLSKTSLFTWARSWNRMETSCSPLLDSHSERARKQIPWEWSEWMDGWIERLPLSLFLLYSTSLYHNPGRIKPLLPPPIPFSVCPSIPPSLTLTVSLALIFLCSDLLSFLLFFPWFFSTLILRTPSRFFFFQNYFFFIVLVIRHYYKITWEKKRPKMRTLTMKTEGKKGSLQGHSDDL